MGLQLLLLRDRLVGYPWGRLLARSVAVDAVILADAHRGFFRVRVSLFASTIVVVVVFVGLVCSCQCCLTVNSVVLSCLVSRLTVSPIHSIDPSNRIFDMVVSGFCLNGIVDLSRSFFFPSILFGIHTSHFPFIRCRHHCHCHNITH